MCKSLSDSESTTNRPTCSEPSCNSELRTYYVGETLVAECTNNQCRLFMVTLTPEALAALTEEQRQQWAVTTAYFRHLDQEDETRRNNLLARIPSHLHKLG
jgi:hypothetical protein